MTYTVNQLATLAGVSPRTLRWYDHTGLLRPARAENGYRRYGAAELARLQQILFYRQAGVPLAEIARLLDAPDFDARAAMQAHLDALLLRRAELDTLIGTAQKTLGALKGECTMTDQETFEGFKQALIDENEAKYGEEVRSRWGDAEADASNAKLMNMSQEQYADFKALDAQLNAALKQAVAQSSAPTGPQGLDAARLHKRWLCFHWPQYSAQAHQNLTQMYVDDERFAAYYDNIAPGAAVFLRDAVAAHAGALEQE